MHHTEIDIRHSSSWRSQDSGILKAVSDSELQRHQRAWVQDEDDQEKLGTYIAALRRTNQVVSPQLLNRRVFPARVLTLSFSSTVFATLADGSLWRSCLNAEEPTIIPAHHDWQLGSQQPADGWIEMLASDLRGQDLAGLRLTLADGVTDKGLESLALLSGFERLALFADSRVTERGILAIARLEGLLDLYLNGVWLGSSGLHWIANLERLVALHLQDCVGWSGESIRDLSSHESLTILRIGSAFDRVDLRDEHLSPLRSLPNLRRLSLRNCLLSDAGMRTLGQLTQLRKLELPNEITDQGIGHLTGLCRLEVLDLSDTSCSDEGLDVLSAFPRLRVLHLGEGMRGSGLGSLASETLLELVLSNGTLCDPLMLAEIPATLRTLNVEVDESDLGWLRRFAQLEDLTLRVRGAGQTDPNPLTELANLRTLRLTLRTGMDCGPLRGLRKLRVLALRFPCPDTAFLAGIEKLESLVLNCENLTNELVTRISNLRHLQVLILLGTSIDVNLTQFSLLSDLRQLSLFFRNAKHDVLESLTELSQLESLSLSELLLSDALRLQLQVALPSCSVGGSSVTSATCAGRYRPTP